jgi:hypothetical protein
MYYLYNDWMAITIRNIFIWGFIYHFFQVLTNKLLFNLIMNIITGNMISACSLLYLIEIILGKPIVKEISQQNGNFTCNLLFL